MATKLHLILSRRALPKTVLNILPGTKYENLPRSFNSVRLFSINA